MSNIWRVGASGGKFQPLHEINRGSHLQTEDPSKIMHCVRQYTASLECRNAILIQSPEEITFSSNRSALLWSLGTAFIHNANADDVVNVSITALDGRSIAPLFNKSIHRWQGAGAARELCIDLTQPIVIEEDRSYRISLRFENDIPKYYFSDEVNNSWQGPDDWDVNFNNRTQSCINWLKIEDLTDLMYSPFNNY